jgi:uncharacterized protein YigA (DUF484 family)
MDWAATTFGTMVAIIGALFAGVVALAKRELDNARDRADRLEDRLRALEQDHFVLSRVTNHLKRKMDEQVTRMFP